MISGLALGIFSSQIIGCPIALSNAMAAPLGGLGMAVSTPDQTFGAAVATADIGSTYYAGSRLYFNTSAPAWSSPRLVQARLLLLDAGVVGFRMESDNHTLEAWFDAATQLWTGAVDSVADQTLAGDALLDTVTFRISGSTAQVLVNDTAVANSDNLFTGEAVRLLIYWDTTAAADGDGVAGEVIGGAWAESLGPVEAGDKNWCGDALPFTPRFLYANSVQGAWYDTFDQATLFQDEAGTTPVTADVDPVGRRNDKSGNGNHQTQSTTSQKPTYRTDGERSWLQTDGGDQLIINVPTGGWAGTYIQGTNSGAIIGEISVPAGSYTIPSTAAYDNEGTDHQLIIVDRVLTPEELSDAVDYVNARCEVTDFSNKPSMGSWFRDRTDLTSLDLSHWAPAGNVDNEYFLRGCSNLVTAKMGNWNSSDLLSFAHGASSLESLDVSGITTTGATRASSFAYGCANLAVLEVNHFDTSNMSSISSFIYGCAALTTLDISNWVTHNCINFAFFANNSGLQNLIINGGTGNPFADSPCTNYTSAFLNTNLTQQSIDDLLVAIESAGTSNGTFSQSGGSAPSAIGQAAIDAMRARGWNVTVTGGY